MSKISKILNCVGLWPEVVKENEQRALVEYQEGKKEKLELHKAFLQGLQRDEDSRLTLIESKTSQLFSQTGIIIAILGLFIPLIGEKIRPPWVQIPFIIFLCFAGFFYLLTIINAGKNFDIHKFKYPRSTASNVLNKDLKTGNDFIAEEIRDLLYSIPIHIKLNNKKGSNLLKAHTSFKVANILTVLLAVALCIAMLLSYRKNDTLKVKIDGVVLTDQEIQK